ncbi:iron reductase domain protein [Macroventuria anomochaeta]|uniref:Iron reductase domain protein n=1 Tax=Macroventuria anomochaeta TaxID=301207 RepID=A0ACB6RIS7_9PLEO|nr:iron reductase domain protein [Macroventuria anomochaeta]KAF2621252.1 iron reductase domain protein [Macroventuria anomochaeta]
MFVVYTSADGNNVTLSPRSSSGYSMPTLNSNTQVELLEGSGVSNGIMTANVKCSNCNSWSGGTADFKASSGNWIYAYQSSGGALNSNDQSASIRQHNQHDSFSWDYTNAKGGSSVNPLVNAAPAGTGTGSGTGSGGSTRQNLPYCDDTSSGTGGFTSIGSGGGGSSQRRTMLITHGVLASLAFVILFPAGAIAIRLASFPGVVWFHAAFQVFAYLVYIAAFGLGVYIASGMEMLDHYHPIIGIVVFILVFLQPILGFMHHALFKKYQSRTLWSYLHIWVGRIAVTLGIINGGLGLQWADSMNMSSRGGIIAYAVIAVAVWLAWVAAMVIGERRRARKLADAPPKYAQRERGGSRRRSTTGDDTDSSDDIQLVNSRMHGHYAPKNQADSKSSAALCQVFDSIFYDVPMSRVKFNANTEYAYLQNFKVLQNTFAKHQIDKPIRVESLVKCKMQDNLEFLQFVKQYWDQHFPGHEYDPVARRGAKAVVGGGAPAPRATPAAARRAPAASNTAAPRTRTPLAASGGAASAALREENTQLKETVSGLERERDFYFSKLRDIELLIQQAMEADPELEKDEGLLKQIQNILYSTEEGFEIPAEGAEGAEEETF